MNAEDTNQVSSPSSSRIILPYHQDPLAALTKLILGRYRHKLPDLTKCTVLLPQAFDAPRLRRKLLDETITLGHQALLGPRILSLRQWLNESVPSQVSPLSPQAQELILMETLSHHRGLYKDSDPWLLAANLLDLFEQLTLYRATLPARLETFVKQLSNAYQLGTHNPMALSMEANLVHTLWRAWHRQLHDEGRTDPQAAYIAQLDDSLAKFEASQHIFLAGYIALTPAEQRWMNVLIDRGQLTVVTNGHTDGEIQGDPYGQFLDEVFACIHPDTVKAPIKERAMAFASQLPHSPAGERLFVYTAPSAEAEARGIDIQVRRWLLQGKQRIAIVSDDRRLARRIRALLERADINLNDAAGWALSTTAAAAALERWLECLEEDFSYLPLTDLLKSHFIFPHSDHKQLLQAVYRFEQDLVLHENIPRNIQRYRTHLAYRRSRWPQAIGARVQGLLDDIEEAARPLLPSILNKRPQSPRHWLDALEASLQRLGLLESFARDAAGVRILQEVQVMRQALSGRRIKMTWREFRTWLGRTLERYNFQPPINASSVRLLSLEQSALASYDAILIAGTTSRYLPGIAPASPFFNEGVRLELGLPGHQERRTMRFNYFRRLLQAAPQVFITTRQEEKGEPIPPSPWLEALQSFHRISYGKQLNDGGLGALVDNPSLHVIRCDTDALPAPTTMPAPRALPALLPDKLSANAYQQLIDCPYQFFAARCLQLSAPEEVREALEKSDYGQRIHLALHAFHNDVQGYPGPYREAITIANRDSAIRCLEDISKAIFAKDLEDNFMHRGWLQRWRQVIPQYIDWQIIRVGSWKVIATEVALDRPYHGLKINGRIDRLDQSNEGVGIVDYKTGTIPHKDMVVGGEKVQLIFYALVTNRPIHQVEYLSLDGNRFGSRTLLQGDELYTLVERNAERLRSVMDELVQGANLPAWGDEYTCDSCAMSGVCRRPVWAS